MGRRVLARDTSVARSGTTIVSVPELSTRSSKLDWVALNPQPLPPRYASLAARGIIVIGG